MSRKIYHFEEPKPLFPELTDQLAQEFLSETTSQLSFEDEIIIREDHTPYETYHITVVWDDWEFLEKEVRGKIILDAYKQAFGDQESNKITIALGITKKEAQEIKIDL